ncbi:uncharacterized protein crebzf isoform 2-T2 [Aulostomus maculatus]
MITRRRGRSNAELQSHEVDVLESAGDLPSPSEGFPAGTIDTSEIEQDGLFGIEDLEWLLDRDTASPIFDVELAELGLYRAKDQDSGIEASTTSSPERISSGLKLRNRQNQSSLVINKNAIAARLNRLKKKEYVNSLENKVGIMSTENNMLKQENSQLTKRVEELEDETRGPTQTTTTMPYRGSA